MKPSEIPVGSYYCWNDNINRDEMSHPIITDLVRTGWFKKKGSSGTVRVVVYPKEVYAVSYEDPDWIKCAVKSEKAHWNSYQSTFYAHGACESYMGYDIFGLTGRLLSEMYDGIHILHYKINGKRKYRKGLMTIKTGHIKGYPKGLHWCPEKKLFRGLGRYGYLVDLEELEDNYKKFGVKDALKVLNRRLRHQKNEQIVIDNPYYGY